MFNAIHVCGGANFRLSRARARHFDPLRRPKASPPRCCISSAVRARTTIARAQNEASNASDVIDGDVIDFKMIFIVTSHMI